MQRQISQRCRNSHATRSASHQCSRTSRRTHPRLSGLHTSSGLCIPQQRTRLGGLRAAAAAEDQQPTAVASASSGNEFIDVEEIKGIRLVLRDGVPATELWVKWKDDGPETWEATENLSDDLIRNYQEGWWTAVKKGESETVLKFLAGGREVLCEAVDENRRSALHFAAGLGRLDVVKMLIDAGADLNLQDKEGYTPLHMAAGYMQTQAMNMLLEAGADPEIKDNKGQDVVGLVGGLKEKMPFTPQTATTILALEDVTNALNDNLYDEVDPAAILEVREVNGERQFLVQYVDGADDEWLPESYLSKQVVEDWENGLEYREAASVLAIEQLGEQRRYKVRWADGTPDSWEPEEHISDDLIQLWEQEHPEFIRDEKRRATQLALLEQRKAAAAAAAGGSDGQHLPRMQAPPAGIISTNGNGSSAASGNGSAGAVERVEAEAREVQPVA